MDERTVITIGREFGSGGHEIGMKLAEKLGIKCYDKELLQVAAKESGLCEELFASQDEKPTNRQITPHTIHFPLQQPEEVPYHNI